MSGDRCQSLCCWSGRWAIWGLNAVGVNTLNYGETNDSGFINTFSDYFHCCCVFRLIVHSEIIASFTFQWNCFNLEIIAKRLHDNERVEGHVWIEKLYIRSSHQTIESVDNYPNKEFLLACCLWNRPWCIAKRLDGSRRERRCLAKVLERHRRRAAADLNTTLRGGIGTSTCLDLAKRTPMGSVPESPHTSTPHRFPRWSHWVLSKWLWVRRCFGQCELCAVIPMSKSKVGQLNAITYPEAQSNNSPSEVLENCSPRNASPSFRCTFCLELTNLHHRRFGPKH